MKSALYRCRVVHERFTPRRHRFRYEVFSFCLDLDEIDDLARRIPIFSRNRFNLYSFHDRDHLDGTGELRTSLAALLRRNGIERDLGRVSLLTNPRIAGYVFNPVSFFYCFDREGVPLAVVAEVNNTYGERKCYVIGPEGRDAQGVFSSRQTKYFYISPFMALDAELDLSVGLPDERLLVSIDDYHDGVLVLTAGMSGRREPLTTARLVRFAFVFPLLTVQIISAIHWQAFRLWLKRVPFIRKNDRPELQRGVATRPVAAARSGQGGGTE